MKSREFNQAGYDVRCEWGLHGVRTLAPGSDAVVIVDVLSFSTALDIVVSRGGSVIPRKWKDSSAETFAAKRGAILAGGRSAPSGYSLSPVSLLSFPPDAVLVLPSPNGATLSLAATKIANTYTACLRNCEAVAASVCGKRVAVVPAGERWHGGSLRPALEDWIGAGALIAKLPGTRSPEAEMAVASFERFRGQLQTAITECGSGRELRDRGFSGDVELAADYACSSSVPYLNPATDCFENAG
jgi:2-phosphosulfolactate phosphatase